VNPPPTPTLDKRSRAIEEGHSQAIGDFLAWLGEQGIHRMHWVEDPYLAAEAGRPDGGYWEPDGRSIDRLLADYFEIDLVQVEAEQRAVLAFLREQHDRAAP